MASKTTASIPVITRNIILPHHLWLSDTPVWFLPLTPRNDASIGPNGERLLNRHRRRNHNAPPGPRRRCDGCAARCELRGEARQPAARDGIQGGPAQEEGLEGNDDEQPARRRHAAVGQPDG